MKIYFFIMCWLVCVLTACSSQSPETDPSRPQPKISLNQRLDQSNGYKQDSSGNWVPKINKRSSFENQADAAGFSETYKKKAFKTSDYSTKSWWGNKNYKTKSFDSSANNPFSGTSRFDNQSANESNINSSLRSNYETQQIETNGARENQVYDLARPSDAETAARRRVYQAPEIIDYTQQRSLTLKQSKDLLNR